jgi:pimeloyl-ACP methyl ester carboxylesterase
MPSANIEKTGNASAGFEMNYEVHAGLLPMDTIFLHGNLASNNWWRPALEIWKKNAKPGLEGRAIFAEWRGCGQSGAPATEADLNPETLAQDYIDLLENLGIKKTCLVGHSTGGLIGLIAMMRKPSLFDRAVLLDSVAASSVQFEKPMYDAFTQMSTDRAFCAAILGATIHGNDAANPAFQQLVDDAYNIAKINWHGVPNTLSKIDVTSELSAVKHPVLVCHGEFDSLLPKEKSVEMSRKLGNGTFMEIQGQGHSCNFENPQKFVTTVDQFLFQR